MSDMVDEARQRNMLLPLVAAELLVQGRALLTQQDPADVRPIVYAEITETVRAERLRRAIDRCTGIDDC